jgi:hypothetical protein
MPEDEYSGDVVVLKALWPDADWLTLDSHEHHAACGGLYAHEHEDGRIIHSHPHAPCAYCVQSGFSAPEKVDPAILEWI